MKKVFITIFIISFLFLPVGVKAAASDVVFTEIMYDLAGSDTDHEWVEIYNAGNDPVTIVEGSGDNSWRFNEGSNHIFTLAQGSLTLPAGAVAVLAGDGAVFLTDHPGFSGTLIDTVMSLNNTSDTLKLSADKGATFFGEVVYQNTWGGGGDGKSLEKINLNGGNEQGNWRASAADGGAPGTVTTSSSTTSTTTTPSGSTSQSTTSSGGSGSSGGTASAVPVLKAEAGSDIIIEAGKPMAFSGLASQGATAYKWYLGDGSTKEGAEITYTYQFPGTYLVTLEVGNGADMSIDQLRVFVFGSKAVISEFFIGSASTTGQWLELANPNNISVDMSGWILASAETKFILPNFVLIPPKSYLVLSQKITGLDLSRSNKIELKYPNEVVVDTVSFEKNLPDASANRSENGFFWSRELTPGYQNVILSNKLNSLQNPASLTRQVLLKPAEKINSLAVSSYSNVAQASLADITPEVGDNPVASAQINFWQKISRNFFFWIFSTIFFGGLISFLYLISIRRKNF